MKTLLSQLDVLRVFRAVLGGDGVIRMFWGYTRDDTDWTATVEFGGIETHVVVTREQRALSADAFKREFYWPLTEQLLFPKWAMTL